MTFPNPGWRWWELLWIDKMDATYLKNNKNDRVSKQLSRDKIRMNPNLINFPSPRSCFLFYFSYFGFFFSNFQRHMSTGPSLALATNWYRSEIGLVLAILFQVWPQHGITRIFSFACVHLLKEKCSLNSNCSFYLFDSHSQG